MRYPSLLQTHPNTHQLAQLHSNFLPSFAMADQLQPFELTIDPASPGPSPAPPPVACGAASAAVDAAAAGATDALLAAPIVDGVTASSPNVARPPPASSTSTSTPLTVDNLECCRGKGGAELWLVGEPRKREGVERWMGGLRGSMWS